MRKGRDGRRTIISLSFTLYRVYMSIGRAFILVMFGNVNSYIHVVTCWTKAKGIHFVLEMFICRQNTCVLYEGPTYRFGGTRMRVRKRLRWGDRPFEGRMQDKNHQVSAGFAQIFCTVHVRGMWDEN